MSRRGGKRKPVLQLGNSSSKLHRYGYSKEFHSKDKKGKGLMPSLIGDYSDTDSEGSNDTEEHVANEAYEQDDDIDQADSSPAPVAPTEDGDPGGQEKPADMDDELKNFLSEIEAIPMPAEIVGGREQTNSTPEPKTEPGDGGDAEPHQDAVKSKGKSNNHHYSMFVKGEPEFVHSPGQEDSNDKDKEKKSKKKEEKEDIPDEPTTNWQMVQDETTHYYYYWNMVTNQVTWEIPTEYTQFLLLHREYEEKMAKYTPEQRQAFKEKKAKNALNNTDGSHSDMKTSSAIPTKEVKHNDHGPVAPASLAPDGKHYLTGRDGDPLGRGPSPAKSLSPRPESNNDSRRHHKHKKEKRSHHKKKHKRRHSDSDSEEDTRSPRMPDIGPPVLSESTPAPTSAPKLPSIVPYLSDQDEEDDDDDDDKDKNSAMPELGPPAIPVVDSQLQPPVEGPSQDGESAMPELGPAIESASNVSENIPADSAFQQVNSEQVAGIDPNVLLLPPPPPPPEEEDGKGDLSKEQNDTDVTKLEGVIDNKDERVIEAGIVSENISHEDQVADGNKTDVKELGASTNDSGDSSVSGNVGLTKIDVISDIVSNEDKVPKSDEIVHTKIATADTVKPHKSKSKKKEVIDMFAEEFPILNSSENTSVEPVSANNAISEEKIEKILPETKAREEPMEEGELSESSEKDIAPSKQPIPDASLSLKNKLQSLKSKEVVEKKSSNVLNIVGYGSDEDEEEGELKENDIQEEKLHSKKKKKDKKKESKKHKKDIRIEASDVLDSKLEKNILSKVSASLDQTISKIVSKTVGQAVAAGITSEKSEKSVVDGDDVDEIDMIDIDDLDDIDRALEVALEKKLERKKVELAKYSDKEKKKEGSSTTIPEVTGLEVKGQIVKAPDVTHLISKDKQEGSKTDKLEGENVVSEAEIKEMADLALSKLEFLDISTDNLSRLQILFVELQTRHTDWTAGGLSTPYFVEQLKVAEGLLEQYEHSAVPEGWACQWDRANNRYYYRNKTTNRIQWEYPEVEGREKTEEKMTVSRESSTTKVNDAGTDEQRKQRSSGSSRHRKREEKDRGKYDKRSSSHRYRRKRRRRRDHSSSSESSEESQQHRHHHKSKKKKRHRTDRSPSVEIVEDVDRMDIEEIDDSPPRAPQLSTPPESELLPEPPAKPPSLSSAMEENIIQGVQLPPPPPPGAPEDGETNSVTEMEKKKRAEGGGTDDSDNAGPDEEEAAKKEPKNAAVISKPPQIVVPPQVAAAITPELQLGPELYSAPQIMTSAQSSSSISAPHSDQVLLTTETNNESADTTSESDKHGKKKKKDKKPLATGSSIMMKKKHMSSMVQKWQKVKKEVEKEDQAKEMRQAAIRKKIEELK